MSPEATYEEAEEWAKRVLGEKVLGKAMELSLGSVDAKMSLYAAYVQYLNTKSIEESSKRVESLTIVVMLVGLVAAYFTAAFYFSQIPGVGFTFAPLLAL